MAGRWWQGCLWHRWSAVAHRRRWCCSADRSLFKSSLSPSISHSHPLPFFLSLLTSDLSFQFCFCCCFLTGSWQRWLLPCWVAVPLRRLWCHSVERNLSVFIESQDCSFSSLLIFSVQFKMVSMHSEKLPYPVSSVFPKLLLIIPTCVFFFFSSIFCCTTRNSGIIFNTMKEVTLWKKKELGGSSCWKMHRRFKQSKEQKSVGEHQQTQHVWTTTTSHCKQRGGRDRVHLTQQAPASSDTEQWPNL